jgi:argininosuccinate lyase
VPFRQAHDLVGKVLREAEKLSKPWTGLSLAEAQRISPLFERDFLTGLSVESAIASKRVPGGTAEESVRAAIGRLEQILEQKEKQP